MSMSNREISRSIRAFQEARNGWLDMLVKNPRNNTAASEIVSINHKIELLECWWSWSDETIDFPS